MEKVEFKEPKNLIIDIEWLNIASFVSNVNVFGIIERGIEGVFSKSKSARKF